jgi:hypothetical protein
MGALVIPLGARVVEVVVTVVEPVAMQPIQVLVLVLAVAVVAIAVAHLAGETGGPDHLTPSQTSPVLAAAGRDRRYPRPLRVRQSEVPLLLLFILLPTMVEVEAPALPVMVEGVVEALGVVGAATMVLMRSRREAGWVVLVVWGSVLIILMVPAVAAVVVTGEAQAMGQVEGAVDGLDLVAPGEL